MTSCANIGDSVDGYWPDDEWLPATLSKVKADGTLVIVLDADSSQSEVAADHVRAAGSGDLAEGEACENEVAEVVEKSKRAAVAIVEEDAADPAADAEMDALMAAAMAAGACDEADGFVDGAKDPC